ncbi:hypothetical protein LXL04_029464 [Taraxacum kok-saghyz]
MHLPKAVIISHVQLSTLPPQGKRYPPFKSPAPPSVTRRVREIWGSSSGAIRGTSSKTANISYGPNYVPHGYILLCEKLLFQNGHSSKVVLTNLKNARLILRVNKVTISSFTFTSCARSKGENIKNANIYKLLFTPSLVEVYNELAPNGDLDIVFISADEDLDSFNGYFSKMPWLAVPFSDSKTRESLDKSFKVNGIPHLVFLDENGKLLTDRGVEIISEYGSEAYPFTPERMKEIKDEEEEARKNQSLNRDRKTRITNFQLGSNIRRSQLPNRKKKYNTKVPVSDLTGKHTQNRRQLKTANSKSKGEEGSGPGSAMIFREIKNLLLTYLNERVAGNPRIAN